MKSSDSPNPVWCGRLTTASYISKGDNRFAQFSCRFLVTNTPKTNAHWKQSFRPLETGFPSDGSNASAHWKQTLNEWQTDFK